MRPFLRAIWKPLLIIVICAAVAFYYRVMLEDLASETVSVYLAVIPYVIGTAIWLSGAYAIDRVLNVMVWEPLNRRIRVPSLQRNLVSILIYAFAITGVVGVVFGYSITAFLTAGGALGIVVGLALRNLIVDLFVGLAMNFDRPFEIGHFIRIQNGPAGQVVEINWRTTRIVDSSGDMIIVPNNRIGDATVTNFSRPEGASALEVPITLEASVRPERVLRVLNAALMSISGTHRCLEKPAPYAQIRNVNAVGIEYGLVYYIDSNKAGPAWARHLVLEAALEHLHLAGIGIAVPKQDVFHAEMPQRQFDARALEDRQTLVKRIQLFSGLLPEEQKAVAVSMQERFYKGGSTIITSGAPGESMFVVFEGLVDVMVSLAEGQPETRVARLKAGTFFGEMSMMTGAPRSATVKATTDTVAYEISKDDLAPLIRARPEIARTLAEVVAQRRAADQAARAGAASANAQEEQRSFVQQTMGRVLKFFGLS